MNREALEKAYDTLYCLLAAWIHNVPAEIVEMPDFDTLFEIADKHLLTAAACFALESTGLMAQCPAETAGRFQEKKMQSIRKTLLVDAEREKLLALLEKKGIWYAPLKGMILNRLYPRYGARQFADNDILIDAGQWQEIRNFMKLQGYKAENMIQRVHGAYYKPPFYIFEMHRALFAEEGAAFLSGCVSYYRNVKERLVKDTANGFGYHFSSEDHYVYILAHTYKHYIGGGTGLRSVLDVYLYRQAEPGMNRTYVMEELKKLGLENFEPLFCSLGEKLFGPPPVSALTEAERKTLTWIENSDVYGTAEHRAQNDMRRLQQEGSNPAKARARYLLERMFPGREWYRDNAPFAYHNRWARPFVWSYRFFRGVFINGRVNLKMLASAMRWKQSESQEDIPQ